MADQVHTKDQLNLLFQEVVFDALGIDEQAWIDYQAYLPVKAAYDAYVVQKALYDAAILAGDTWTDPIPTWTDPIPSWTDSIPLDPYTTVRVAWLTGGQPAWGVADDVVCVECTIGTTSYSFPRNVKQTEILDSHGLDTKTLNRATEYTRIVEVSFIAYGPNSLENSRLIKDALYDDEDDKLAVEHLYLVADENELTRVPELWQSQWWERVDYTARFNEEVVVNKTIGTIGSADIELIVRPEGLTETIHAQET